MLQDFLVVSVARPYSATVSGEPARALPGRPGLQTDVSSVVRALLGLKGLHQADLAPVLRISSSGVNEKLRGKRRWTLEDVDALAKFFQCDPVDFLSGPDTFLRRRGNPDISVQKWDWTPSFVEAHGQLAFAFPTRTAATPTTDSDTTYQAVA